MENIDDKRELLRRLAEQLPHGQWAQSASSCDVDISGPGRRHNRRYVKCLLFEIQRLMILNSQLELDRTNSNTALSAQGIHIQELHAKLAAAKAMLHQCLTWNEHDIDHLEIVGATPSAVALAARSVQLQRALKALKGEKEGS